MTELFTEGLNKIHILTILEKPITFHCSERWALTEKKVAFGLHSSLGHTFTSPTSSNVNCLMHIIIFLVDKTFSIEFKVQWCQQGITIYENMIFFDINTRSLFFLAFVYFIGRSQLTHYALLPCALKTECRIPLYWLKSRKAVLFLLKRPPSPKGEWERQRQRAERLFLLWFALFVPFPSFLFFFIFIVDSFADVPIACPPPPAPAPYSFWPSPYCCLCPWVTRIHICSLANPFTCFHLSFHFLYKRLIWEWNRRKDGIQQMRNHWAKTPDVVRGTTEEALFQCLRDTPG